MEQNEEQKKMKKAKDLQKEGSKNEDVCHKILKSIIQKTEKQFICL
jgi:hypothetical protein